MFKLLEKSRAPRKIWSDTLAELALQALKSDMAWDAAHAASKRFTERANSAGMELTLDAEVFAPRRPVAPKIQVAESPIRLGFSARCKRFLSRLIP